MKQRQLIVGDKAPEFWKRDIHGTVVDSRSLKGYTLIAFLRYAGCPFCNVAIYNLNHEYAKLKHHGCDVVAFIQSTDENIEKNIIAKQDETPPFSIIADHEQDIYRLFKITPNVLRALRHSVRHAPEWFDATVNKGFTQANVDGNAAIVPAYFLVKDGQIALSDYSADLYDTNAFGRIYEILPH